MLDRAFESIVAPNTRLDTIATIPGASGEGPNWRDGRLWFSDQKNGRIYAVATNGDVKVIAELAGGPIDPALRFDQGPNAEIPYKGGALLFMRLALRDIGLRARDGTVSSFLHDYQGKRFNSPNDMVIDAHDRLWFTDPTFSVPPGGRELPYAAVFRYDHGVLAPVVTDLPLPNGIGFSPDGRTLYVANSRPMLVRAYDVAADGTLGNPRDFAQFTPIPNVRGAPDGLRVDSKGNVWTTGPGGVTVFSPKGVPLGRIQLPVSCSNLAFGEDFRSVFFTCQSTIYRIRSLVKGQVPRYYVKQAERQRP